MESPKHSRTHPVVLLVEEIENLQAQTQLMEICLKEAQLAAENRIAVIEEHYDSELSGLRAALNHAGERARADNEVLRTRIGELESAASSVRADESDEKARQSLTHEITRLRSSLAQQECAAARQESVLKAELHQLAAEVNQRNDELAEQRDISDQANIEIGRLRSEIAALRDKNRQFNEMQEGLERNLLDAHAAQMEDSDSRRTPLSMDRLIEHLNAKIHDLQLQLAAQQLRVESRAMEVFNLKAELNRVTQQLAQREFNTNALTASRGEERGIEPRGIGDGRSIEETTMKREDGDERTAQNAAELQQPGATQSGLEQPLRNEIDRLLHEAREKNQILQDRNDELVRVKAEMDKLQERLNQLESSTSRAQSTLVGDAERMHTEFQAQLALLQAELSQKEWALEEKQAAARGLEVKYRQEIEALRRQLAKRDLSISAHGGELGGEPRLNLVQREQSAAIQSAESRAGEASPQENRRRWRSALSRKRRWR